MDVSVALRSLAGTYLCDLPYDVIQYCIAPYLTLTSETSIDLYGQVNTRITKDIIEDPVAVNFDDSIIVISTNKSTHKSHFRTINPTTQKRRTVVSHEHYSEIDPGRMINMTCGTGWFQRDNAGCVIWTFDTEKPTRAILNSQVVPVDETHVRVISPHIDQVVALPGKVFISLIMDAHRFQNYTIIDDSMFIVNVINLQTAQIEFSMPTACIIEQLARCGAYWIALVGNQQDKVINVYDNAGTQVDQLTITIYSGSIKLMAHPIKPIFAIVVSNDIKTEYGLTKTVKMYTITERDRTERFKLLKAEY